MSCKCGGMIVYRYVYHTTHMKWFYLNEHSLYTVYSAFVEHCIAISVIDELVCSSAVTGT